MLAGPQSHKGDTGQMETNGSIRVNSMQCSQRPIGGTLRLLSYGPYGLDGDCVYKLYCF